MLEIGLGPSYKPSVQEVFFPLYDVVTFENHANHKNIDLHIGIPECQIYHSALTASKSQIEVL
jgi:hypothetical protein